MANKTNIRRLAKILSLTTLSNKNFELKELNVSNLDYLEYILEQEMAARRNNRVLRNRRSSGLPDLTFDIAALNDGLKYQVERLSELKRIESSTNLLVTGTCGIGKTALVTHLACLALEKEYKVLYLTQDELLTAHRNKSEIAGARAVIDKANKADLIIVDDFLYLTPGIEELDELYRVLLSLNKGASLTFISNRDISDWIATAPDKYNMQLLIDRILAKAEVLKLY